MRARVNDLLGFLLFVFRRWREDRCPEIAGGLTFTTLLALVPMFAIAVAVLSSAPFFEDLMSQIKIFLLLNLLPEIAGKIITVYMVAFADNATRLTWAGILAVFVIAVALMLTIDRSLNRIWRVRLSRPFWLSVVGYVVLLVTGPLLMGVSVSMTTYLMTASIEAAGVPVDWHSDLLRLVPMVVSGLAFYLIYTIIPHRRVSHAHAAIGAVAAALLFEAVKDVFAVYVRNVPAYSVVYGAFAAVPVFMIWVYLSWLVVLLGAELTAALGYWRGGLWKHERTAGVRFRTAIRLVRAMMKSAPAPVALERLPDETGIPAQEVEDTLLQMAEARLVRRVSLGEFALAKRAAEVTFEDVYRGAVGPVEGVQPADLADLSPEFARAAGALEDGLSRPLATVPDEPVDDATTAASGTARIAASFR